jgi:Ser/Thr protein kinase RdoA (MazF antagonist)
MVLFDAIVKGRDNLYQTFQKAFVDGYIAHSAETPFDLDALPTFIDLRVGILHKWLAEPRLAPTGIRTATPQWRYTLEQFVEQYWNQARPQ